CAAHHGASRDRRPGDHGSTGEGRGRIRGDRSRRRSRCPDPRAGGDRPAYPAAHGSVPRHSSYVGKDSGLTMETFILFTVAGTTYGIRSSDVQHMQMVEQETRVHNRAAFVGGVVFSRGQVVPVVNLRARFGFERAPYDLA